MGLLSDRQIKALCQTDKPMIEPFVEKQMREGIISYGLSSYGYDIRVAEEFKIFTPNPYNTVVDPKHIDERSLIPFEGEVCIIPPNSFTLARSVEYLRIPRNILVITVGKSTFARCHRREAASLARAEGLADRITFREDNAEALSLPDNSVDVSLSFTVMEEVDADRMLHEMVRVTKPGGRVGVVVRAADMELWTNLALRPDLLAKI